MNSFYQHAVTVFMGFFAVMNPIANTAVFIGLVGERSDAERAKIAVKSLIIAFGIVAVFAGIGKLIFEMFGITLPALKIAGGVLVFIIGYHMLQGKSSKMHSVHSAATDGSVETASNEEPADVAVSPLAMPILAGPGTLATARNFAAGGRLSMITTTIVVFAIICLITLVCFLLGERLTKVLGDSGLRIMTQLMGLVMAVIGTQMLIEGIAAFPKSI
jgi:multiple antibiotic resistance protein